MNRSNLHEYQNKMIDFMIDTPNCALFADMGLGKTVSTLTALVDLFDSFEIGRVLIIAPLRVANHTWPEEINTWEHTRDISYDVITGPQIERKKKLLYTKDVHIINRENVPWLVEYLGAKWPYDMVVVDESSSFKSYKSNRFKALRKTLSKISRVVNLTGTPTSNGLMDLWPQIFLLDKGDRLGRTITSYRQRYFTQSFDGYSYDLREGADDKIHNKVKDICLTLASEDYLDMPERIDNYIKLEMSEKVKSKYKEFEKEFVLELEKEHDDIEAPNAAALSNKLLQYCNGAVYYDELKNFEKIHDMKLDALDNIIEEANGAPVLVAYSYKSDLKRIMKKYPKARTLDKSPTVIQEWNEGKIDLLLAHPASAGHGLNLQKGGRISVWFGLPWSLELYQQFNARLHRQGQKNTVVIHHIVVKDSVDQTVINALEGKGHTQRALLDAMKRDIKKRQPKKWVNPKDVNRGVGHLR